MFTTAGLPANMQYDPTQPHICGLPNCPLAEARPADATGVSSGT